MPQALSPHNCLILANSMPNCPATGLRRDEMKRSSSLGTSTLRIRHALGNENPANQVRKQPLMPPGTVLSNPLRILSGDLLDINGD